MNKKLKDMLDPELQKVFDSLQEQVDKPQIPNPATEPQGEQMPFGLSLNEMIKKLLESQEEVDRVQESKPKENHMPDTDQMLAYINKMQEEIDRQYVQRPVPKEDPYDYYNFNRYNTQPRPYEDHYQYQPTSSNDYSQRNQINHSHRNASPGQPVLVAVGFVVFAILLFCVVFVCSVARKEQRREGRAQRGRDLRTPSPTCPRYTDAVTTSTVRAAITPRAHHLVDPFHHANTREDPIHLTPSAPLVPNGPSSEEDPPPSYAEAVGVLKNSNGALHDEI